MTTIVDNQLDFSGSPVAWKFIRTHSRVCGIMGAYGSGKSIACAYKMIMYIFHENKNNKGIAHSRWGVIRQTYRQLDRSTIRDFKFILEQLNIKAKWNEAKKTCTLKFKNIYAEISFIGLDKPEKIADLKSTSFTGIWINEAIEIPESVIVTAIARVGRFNVKYTKHPDGILIMDTNPPDTNSWWYERFEITKAPDWKIFKQPSGLSPEAENLNHLGKHYYHNLKKDMTKSQAKVFVEGEYGVSKLGRIVYDEFNPEFHTVEHDMIPWIQEMKKDHAQNNGELVKFKGLDRHDDHVNNMKIVIGLDFGNTPSAIFGCRIIVKDGIYLMKLQL